MSYTIIANSPYTEGVSAIIFDSIVEMNEQLENTISSYPIESKQERSDNIFTRNNVITLTGIVQNSPIPNTFGNTSQDNLINSGEDRKTKARGLLLELRNKGLFFSLVLKYETYTNCLIKNLSFQESPENSSQLNFTMEVESVRTTTEETVTLSVSKAAGSLTDDITDNSNTGNNNKQEANATVLLDVTRSLFNIDQTTTP